MHAGNGNDLRLAISISIINVSISNLIPTLLHENCDDVLIENRSIIFEVAHFHRLPATNVICLQWNSFGGLWHDFCRENVIRICGEN